MMKNNHNPFHSEDTGPQSDEGPPQQSHCGQREREMPWYPSCSYDKSYDQKQLGQGSFIPPPSNRPSAGTDGQTKFMLTETNLETNSNCINCFSHH